MHCKVCHVEHKDEGVATAYKCTHGTANNAKPIPETPCTKECEVVVSAKNDVKYSAQNYCLKCKDYINLATNDKEEFNRFVFLKGHFVCDNCSKEFIKTPTIPCQHQWFEIRKIENIRYCENNKECPATVIELNIIKLHKHCKYGVKVGCILCLEVRIKWEDGEIEILNQEKL